MAKWFRIFISPCLWNWIFNQLSFGFFLLLLLFNKRYIIQSVKQSKSISNTSKIKEQSPDNEDNFILFVPLCVCRQSSQLVKTVLPRFADCDRFHDSVNMFWISLSQFFKNYFTPNTKRWNNPAPCTCNTKMM